MIGSAALGFEGSGLIPLPWYLCGSCSCASGEEGHVDGEGSLEGCTCLLLCMHGQSQSCMPAHPPAFSGLIHTSPPCPPADWCPIRFLPTPDPPPPTHTHTHSRAHPPPPALPPADFGLTRVVREPLEPLWNNGVVVTIWYRAPELLLDAKHYGPGKGPGVWGFACW